MEVWINLLSEKKMSVVIRQIGGKNGVKRSILVDENGIPLSIVVCGANRHDSKMIWPLLTEKMIQAPAWTEEHICLDAGYVWPEVFRVVTEAGYIPHIRPRWEDLSKKKNDPDWEHPDGKPRRWIVEVVHSWFNNFRKIRIRYEKKSKNYLALLHMVAAIICFRKLSII
jgi:transposase